MLNKILYTIGNILVPNKAIYKQKSVSIKTTELILLIEAFIKEKKKFYDTLSCEK